jgi:hypothetical protein
VKEVLAMKVFTGIGLLVTAGFVALVVVSLPEVKRYIKLKMM